MPRDLPPGAHLPSSLLVQGLSWSFLIFPPSPSSSLRASLTLATCAGCVPGCQTRLRVFTLAGAPPGCSGWLPAPPSWEQRDCLPLPLSLLAPAAQATAGEPSQPSADVSAERAGRTVRVSSGFLCLRQTITPVNLRRASLTVDHIHFYPASLSFVNICSGIVKKILSH